MSPETINGIYAIAGTLVGVIATAIITSIQQRKQDYLPVDVRIAACGGRSSPNFDIQDTPYKYSFRITIFLSNFSSVTRPVSYMKIVILDQDGKPFLFLDNPKELEGTKHITAKAVEQIDVVWEPCSDIDPHFRKPTEIILVANDDRASISDKKKVWFLG
jgi:hypothetical protein